jgi:hypothetical protein
MFAERLAALVCIDHFHNVRHFPKLADDACRYSWRDARCLMDAGEMECMK